MLFILGRNNVAYISPIYQTTNYKLQTTNYKIQTTNYKLQNTKYKIKKLISVIAFKSQTDIKHHKFIYIGRMSIMYGEILALFTGVCCMVITNILDFAKGASTILLIRVTIANKIIPTLLFLSNGQVISVYMT